jgi:hypothetical protein
VSDIRPLDFLKAAFRSSVGAAPNKLQMPVWQDHAEVEFLELPRDRFGREILIILDDRPRSKIDRSFLYKLLVQRRNLKLRFANSEVLVFLAVGRKLEELMTRFAGWTAFLEAVRQVGFGVFVIGEDSIMYRGLPSSFSAFSEGKLHQEWSSRDGLTNSVALMLLTSLGDVRYV